MSQEQGPGQAGKRDLEPEPQSKEEAWPHSQPRVIIRAASLVRVGPALTDELTEITWA